MVEELFCFWRKNRTEPPGVVSRGWSNSLPTYRNAPNDRSFDGIRSEKVPSKSGLRLQSDPVGGVTSRVGTKT